MMKPAKTLAILPIYFFVLLGFLSIAQFGSRAVTVMVENAPISNRTCIIVDPGHGGIDGGATSCSGMLESEMNLQIALRVNDLLRFLGYDTRMTRTTDTSIYTEGTTIAAQKVSDLKERVRIVNETNNAILISIHQNTYPESRYKGAQVFYAGDADSQMLAKQMQSTFITALNPGSRRKSKPSNGIYLMQNIHVPGILIECGFISNPSEEAQLRSDGYQKQIACVIGACLSSHMEKK